MGKKDVRMFRQKQRNTDVPEMSSHFWYYTWPVTVKETFFKYRFVLKKSKNEFVKLRRIKQKKHGPPKPTLHLRIWVGLSLRVQTWLAVNFRLSKDHLSGLSTVGHKQTMDLFLCNLPVLWTLFFPLLLHCCYCPFLDVSNNPGIWWRETD